MPPESTIENPEGRREAAFVRPAAGPARAGASPCEIPAACRVALVDATWVRSQEAGAPLPPGDTLPATLRRAPRGRGDETPHPMFDGGLRSRPDDAV